MNEVEQILNDGNFAKEDLVRLKTLALTIL